MPTSTAWSNASTKCAPHLSFETSIVRRQPQFRHSLLVQIPFHRLDSWQEPFGHHTEGLFCFNSSIPATSPGVAPGLKSCRLGQAILRSTLQLLAAVGRLAVQTVIDEPLAGRLLSAQSGWRITSYAPRA